MFQVKTGFGAVAVMAALAVVPTAGPAAGSGWTVVPVPATGGVLRAVSADSGSDAWAVGVSAKGVALGDHWNGTSWQQVPVPPTGSFGSLNAVSAASPTDAWAVGQINYGGTQFAVHWDGTAWTVLDPGFGSAGFGVADIGPGNAWAVGLGLEHWDGTSWTGQAYPSPAPTGTPAPFLAAISAAGASDIWVVGTYVTSTTCTTTCEQTFSLHWDGTSWAEVPMPPVNRSTDPNLEYQLRSVDVISPSDVWAAGYTFDSTAAFGTSLGTLIEHWDGTAWSITPAPSPGTSPVLTGIDGSSSASVWAVGYDTPAGASAAQTLTLFWNGTSWATVPSPNPGSPSQLYSVAVVPGAATTWAVGSYTSTARKTAGMTMPLALKNG